MNIIKTISKIHKKVVCLNNVYVNAHNELVKAKNLIDDDDIRIKLLLISH